MQNSIKLVTRSRGFSLIELMIVVAIIGLLALVAVPYTASWIHHADVVQTASTLKLAYGKAKAVAIRNPLAAREAATGAKEAAAGIKNENATLLVCEGDPSASACSATGSALLWSSPLPGGITLTINGAPLTNLAIDNTGQSINTAGQALIPGYNISKGTQSDAGKLH